MEKFADNGLLHLTPDQMRTLGYRVIDMIVDHHENLTSKSATAHAHAPELRDRLHGPAPELPEDPLAVLDTVERDILSCMTYCNHPRFFAYIPGPANYIGALGDALASGYNVINALWTEASAPAQLELTVLDWIRQWCGLPEPAGGLLVSGGSVANLTCLAVARQIKLNNKITDAVVYCSDQTHGSLEKNLKLLGFNQTQFVKIEADHDFRIDILKLTQQINQDVTAGRRPFCVIANAGTTNTGAVDTLPEIANLCNAHDLWLHVDGAYGAPAVLTVEGKAALQGLELADSIAMDPHKWLFQPFEIGCALVRDARWLPVTFGQEHEYMQDAIAETRTAEVNFCDYGIQLTRGFRALKLWMTVKTYGLAAIREAIGRGMELARHAQSCIQRYPNFEVTSTAQLGITSFRYTDSAIGAKDLDSVNLGIATELMDDGFAMISSTQLRGRSCLRLCPINPRTTQQDVERTIELIHSVGKSLADKIR